MFIFVLFFLLNNIGRKAQKNGACGGGFIPGNARGGGDRPLGHVCPDGTAAGPYFFLDFFFKKPLGQVSSRWNCGRYHIFFEFI
jgi:hypothetical protein